MALIACPDCSQQVSEHAVACPKCGHPVGRPTLIEQTSKRWKSTQLVGAMAFLAGLAATGVCVMMPRFFWLSIPSALLGLCGLGLFIYGKIGAWWETG